MERVRQTGHLLTFCRPLKKKTRDKISPKWAKIENFAIQNFGSGNLPRIKASNRRRGETNNGRWTHVLEVDRPQRQQPHQEDQPGLSSQHNEQIFKEYNRM